MAGGFIMAYADLSPEEMILHAAECVGRGLDIPSEIARLLGPALLQDIQNPETLHDHHSDGDNLAHQRPDTG